MFVEVIEVKTEKKDMIKYLLSKMPLMSKVAQFNPMVENIHIEYVEFKILSYEIISKERLNRFFKYNKKKNNITMFVNTYNGQTQSIDSIPQTTTRYISKSYIKKSKLNEDKMIIEIKNQIVDFLSNRCKNSKLEKETIHDIKMIESKSIYKPYWVAEYKGKSIYLDA
jgi:hypothetical protein